MAWSSPALLLLFPPILSAPVAPNPKTNAETNSDTNADTNAETNSKTKGGHRLRQDLQNCLDHGGNDAQQHRLPKTPARLAPEGKGVVSRWGIGAKVPRGTEISCQLQALDTGTSYTT